LFESRMNFASVVVARLCSFKYSDIISRVESDLGPLVIEKAIKFTMNTYSLLFKKTDGSRVIIKITDNVPSARRLLRNNIIALSIINNIPEVLAPKLIMHGEGFMVVTYLEGQTYSKASAEVRAKARHQIKDIIKVMRSRTLTSQRGEYLDKTRTTLDNLSFEQALVICPWIAGQDREEFVFSHNDLYAENVIVNDDGLAGIIDWEYSCLTPYSYELSKYKHIGDEYTEFIECF
ncbi:hypothetical protein GGF37_000983, partial [Kickxella alabastrina]